MNTAHRAPAPAADDLHHPRTVQAFRSVRLLLFGYLGISVLALVAIVLLRNDAADVTPAVWTRAVIVVVTALVLVVLTARAATGSRGSYRRLRLISIITPVAIAVIIAVPGAFPLWMKIEQGVCGLVMIGVAVIANSAHLRGVFSADRSG